MLTEEGVFARKRPRVPRRLIDAWTGWERGDTYFTFGCNEVVHRRELRVGEIVELVVEFSSAVPAGDAPQNFAVLRIGARRGCSASPTSPRRSRPRAPPT
jgi:hypothetical protein